MLLKARAAFKASSYPPAGLGLRASALPPRLSLRPKLPAQLQAPLRPRASRPQIRASGTFQPVIAMINVDLSPASILGAALVLAGLVLYQIRTSQPRISKDYDVVMSSMSVLVGGILIFQGWRLDPLLLFGQLMTAGVAVSFAAEALKLRTVVSEQEDRQETGRAPIPEDDYSRATAPPPSSAARPGGDGFLADVVARGAAAWGGRGAAQAQAGPPPPQGPFGAPQGRPLPPPRDSAYFAGSWAGQAAAPPQPDPQREMAYEAAMQQQGGASVQYPQAGPGPANGAWPYPPGPSVQDSYGGPQAQQGYPQGSEPYYAPQQQPGYQQPQFAEQQPQPGQQPGWYDPRAASGDAGRGGYPTQPLAPEAPQDNAWGAPAPQLGQSQAYENPMAAPPPPLYSQGPPPQQERNGRGGGRGPAAPQRQGAGGRGGVLDGVDDWD